MQELLKYFSQSLDDFLLSRSEKRALKSILSEKPPSRRERDWLRSHVFDLARKRSDNSNSQQIINWLEEANKILLTPSKTIDSPTKVFFSPGDDCLNCIVEQISYATRKIDICVFTISDNRISDKLLYAHQKGVKIRIITDDDKSFDRGSDIKSLSQHGIFVKTDQSPHHMHHKFALFDEKALITGSYNWTRSAAVYNQENILLTPEKNAVTKYREEFEKLWLKMVDY